MIVTWREGDLRCQIWERNATVCGGGAGVAKTRAQYLDCELQGCGGTQQQFGNDHCWGILQVRPLLLSTLCRRLRRVQLNVVLLCLLVILYYCRVYPYLCRAVRNFARDRARGDQTIPSSKELYVSFEDVLIRHKWVCLLFAPLSVGW